MNIATLKAKGLIRPMTAPPAQAADFPFGLGREGLHEVAEKTYGQRAAATGFVLAANRPAGHHTCLWICQASHARDLGQVSEAALKQMTGRQLLRFSMFARRASEALWAAEEAVVSGAIGHVIAEVDAADFTATRRLALASTRYGVPVTLLLPHDTSGATAAATRWRIATCPSAPNSYDPRASGHSRWQAVLERSRAAPAAAGQSFDLEWNDETLSLRVVSGLAAGPAATRPAQSGPPGNLRRAG